MSDNLRNYMEALRLRMYKMIEEKGISHPDVLAASQMLDEMHNEFNRKTNVESAPKQHIRIEPRGKGFAVIVDHDGEIHEIERNENFEEAKKRAFDIADNSYKPKMDVYYLEQKLEQGE